MPKETRFGPERGVDGVAGNGTASSTMVGTCDGSGAKAISGAEWGITIVCANTGSGFVSAGAGAPAE